MKKFKTMYKSLHLIEKRLDELTLQDSGRGLSKKEQNEWNELIKIARKLRNSVDSEPGLLEIRNMKIEKIKGEFSSVGRAQGV